MRYTRGVYKHNTRVSYMRSAHERLGPNGKYHVDTLIVRIYTCTLFAKQPHKKCRRSKVHSTKSKRIVKHTHLTACARRQQRLRRRRRSRPTQCKQILPHRFTAHTQRDMCTYTHDDGHHSYGIRAATARMAGWYTYASTGRLIDLCSLAAAVWAFIYNACSPHSNMMHARTIILHSNVVATYTHATILCGVCIMYARSCRGVKSSDNTPMTMTMMRPGREEVGEGSLESSRMCFLNFQWGSLIRSRATVINGRAMAGTL